MIDIIRKRIASLASRQAKLNLVREFLQVLVLKILSDAQAFRSIAFVGGTALRILYGLRRYSEDLDFSMVDVAAYDFEVLLEKLAREFSLQNIGLEIKKKRAVVDNCLLNFTTVLQDLEIAVAKDQKLTIKLEIDTNPPKGAITTETIINSDFIFPVRHYDLPSLLAGKLHAVLCRKYCKGRDYYDLLWYLSKGIQPNIFQLENAIMQTENKKIDLSDNKWREKVSARISEVDFKKVRRDLEPFVADPNEVKLVTSDYLLNLLKG